MLVFVVIKTASAVATIVRYYRCEKFKYAVEMFILIHSKAISSQMLSSSKIPIPR